MIKIAKEQLEKKLIGEEAWIDLGDELRIRIDYPTTTQALELRRLSRKVIVGLFNPEIDEHPDSYFMRCVTKDVVGLEYEGVPFKLEFENGIVTNPAEQSKNLIALLIAANRFDKALMFANARLYFGNVEKKSSESSDD